MSWTLFFQVFALVLLGGMILMAALDKFTKE